MSNIWKISSEERAKFNFWDLYADLSKNMKSDELVITCGQCNFPFKIKRDTHQNAMSRGVDKFTCAICDTELYRFYMETITSVEKPSE